MAGKQVGKIVGSPSICFLVVIGSMQIVLLKLTYRVYTDTVGRMELTNFIARWTLTDFDIWVDPSFVFFFFFIAAGTMELKVRLGGSVGQTPDEVP